MRSWVQLRLKSTVYVCNQGGLACAMTCHTMISFSTSPLYSPRFYSLWLTLSVSVFQSCSCINRPPELFSEKQNRGQIILPFRKTGKKTGRTLNSLKPQGRKGETNRGGRKGEGRDGWVREVEAFKKLEKLAAKLYLKT